MPFLRRAIAIKDPFCGASHLLGAAVSLVGLVVLLLAADGRPRHLVGFGIYGLSLVLLYTASGLAHSLTCSPAGEARLQRLDFAAIFLLIAGTYTPICLVNLRGPWGWFLLSAEWILAAVGIFAVYRARADESVRAGRLQLATYLVMGWLVLLAVPPVLRALPAGGVAWLAAGGVVYSAGAVIYATNRPRLWPGRFGAHDLWHCMVLLGSACHFVVMLGYVA